MVLNIEINASTVMVTLAVESIILDYLKESLITEDFVKKFQVLYVKFFRSKFQSFGSH